MGLFNKLGRTVERFKQTATDAAEESASFQCRACDAQFSKSNDSCPECGAREVTTTPTDE